jgi:hypothetical protein
MSLNSLMGASLDYNVSIQVELWNGFLLYT